MSKCHDIAGYKELTADLLADLHGFLPTSNREAARDIASALSLVEHRGLGWLTLTLPEVGKIFDLALSKGRLERISAAGFKPIGGHVSSVIPAFLSGMWMRVFDEEGLLRSEPCIASIASLRQFFNCFKKVRMDCETFRVTATLRDFYEVDASLRPPSHHWDGGCIDDRVGYDLHISDGTAKHDGSQWTLPGFDSEPDPPSSLLGSVQFALDWIASTLGDFVAEDWRAKHGRGAIADAQLGRSFKYDFPSWSAKLESEFPVAFFGFPNYDAWTRWLTGDSDYPSTAFSDAELPSRLITVPKTMKGPRLIASEPTSNQYCQQVILDYVVNKVASTPLSQSLSFHDQTNNQTRALSASRTQDDATIDLSSASDCVSCWLIERAFRRNRPLLRALFASRTSWLVDGISVPQRFHYLRKFTTMGAATTFPIQSLIYVGIALGVICYLRNENTVERILSEMSSVRVFGDDIIVPKDVAQDLVKVLTYLGFRINPNKTFMEGNFRESCGVDAFDGTDVTPAYILETYDKLRPSSIESVRDCANNLFSKGLWRTARTLERTLPNGILSKMPVVRVGSGSPGRTSFSGKDVTHLRKRWNNDLQREEVQLFGMRKPNKRVSTGGSASLLQYFMEAPAPDSMVTWKSGYDERPGMLVHLRWEDPSNL